MLVVVVLLLLLLFLLLQLLLLVSSAKALFAATVGGSIGVVEVFQVLVCIGRHSLQIFRSARSHSYSAWTNGTTALVATMPSSTCVPRLHPADRDRESWLFLV